MPEDTEFLQTEETLSSLLVELSKLKSAVEQIGTAKDSAQVLQVTADKLVKTAAAVIDKGNKSFELIESAQLSKRFDGIESTLAVVGRKVDMLGVQGQRIASNGRIAMYLLGAILVIQIIAFTVLLGFK